MRGVDTFFAVKEQVDLLTPMELTDLEVGDFLAFNSESLGGRQQIIDNPAIRRQAMRSRAYSAMGTMDAGGSVEFTASNFVIDRLLGLVFHSKTGDADTAAGATYTLDAGGELTPFTAFVGFDGPEGFYTRRFTGAKVNTATFSARVNDMLRLNLGISAVNKEILDATEEAVYPGGDDEYAFVYDQASVKLMSGDMAALVEIPVENFDFNINHNLNTGAYRLGSPYRRSLQESQSEIDGSFTVDASVTALNGDGINLDGTTDHDPAFFERVAREARFAALQLQLVDPTKIVVAAQDEIPEVPESSPGEGDGTPAVPAVPAVYASLTISLPYCRLEEPDFNVRDGGLITGSARFVAYDDITVVHIGDLGA
jgi:hypothetical protein